MFTYDDFGRTTHTYVGTRSLSENTYTGNLLTKQEYGNEDFVEFDYDNLDRLYQKKYNGVTKVDEHYGRYWVIWYLSEYMDYIGGR